MPSSLSIIPINSKDEPMDQDDEDVEINVQDDDSPLDMRIRPSVIRRAPSFKETSNGKIWKVRWLWVSSDGFRL